MLDIYFLPEYGKLYEKIEGGVCETFEYKNSDGTVRNMYIKRPVPWLVDGVRYYDVTTPYGYGGPIVTEGTPTEVLLSEYYAAWSSYCADNAIIAEFIRFHPLANNHEGFERYFNIAYCRNTVAIDLTDADYFETQFTSSCRNKIRKAIKNGVTIEIDRQMNSISDFIELYYKTMQKNAADNYFFFEKDYFDEMRASFLKDSVLFKAIYNNTLICASIVISNGDYMHYHLTANDPMFYSLAANNLLLNSIVEYGHSIGKTWLHLGGGLSASEDDPLYEFKRSFGRKETNIRSFFVGKAIHNTAVYDRLVALRKENNPAALNENYFPQYRG